MDPFQHFKSGNEASVALPDGTIVKGVLTQVSFQSSSVGSAYIEFSILADGATYGAVVSYKDALTGVVPHATSMSKEMPYLPALLGHGYDIGYTDEIDDSELTQDQPAPDLSQIEADLAALKSKEPLLPKPVTVPVVSSPLGYSTMYEALKGGMMYGETLKPLPPQPLKKQVEALIYEISKALQAASDEERAEVLKAGTFGMNVALPPPKSFYTTPVGELPSATLIKVLHVKLEVSE